MYFLCYIQVRFSDSISAVETMKGKVEGKEILVRLDTGASNKLISFSYQLDTGTANKFV